MTEALGPILVRAIPVVVSERFTWLSSDDWGATQRLGRGFFLDVLAERVASGNMYLANG